MQQKIQFCHTIDGVRIAYSTVGNGPPLVKTANWLSHIEYDWNSPIWRHWFESLAQRYTLIRYDQRGCGLSDWDVEDLSFDKWILDLEAVVKAVQLERFPLVGLSQGGPVSIAYTQRYPEKVTHLVLYGSYARGRLNRDLTEEQHEETNMLINLIRLGWGKENPAFRQVFTSLYIPDGNQEQQQWMNDLQRVSTTPENAAKIVSGFDAIDVTRLAPQISTPTLIFHAKSDARIPFEEGRILASLIPGAQFIPLEGNNHILLESDPAWNQFLSTFFRFIDTDSTYRTLSNHSMINSLSKREIEVLNLIACGLDNTHIAEKLYISPKTVRNHITRIFNKLDVAKRPEAIVLARKAGLGRKYPGDTPKQTDALSSRKRL